MNIFTPEWNFYVGEITYNEETTYGPRYQSALQLVYIFDGKAKIEFNQDESLTLAKGQITLLFPGNRELFTFSKNTHHGWCYAVSQNIPESIFENYSNEKKVIQMSQDMLYIESIARSRNGDRSESNLESQKNLIRALFYEYFHAASILMPEGNERLHPAVLKARDFICRNLKEEMDLEIIAKQSGISKAHLIRLFRENIGTTPNRYIWKLRLERAAYLMKESGLTAAQVADQCGFSNPQHFSKAFLQHFSMTPRKMRQKAWNIQTD